MGCSASRPYAKITPRNFDKGVMTILTLGTSNCGKTTLLKQMKILHKSGFTSEEKEGFSFLIKNNIVESLCSIINLVTMDEEMKFQGQTLNLAAEVSALVNEYHCQNLKEPMPALLNITKKMLKDPVFETSMQRYRHLVPNFESVTHFFSEIDRISTPGYVPTNKDILFVRSPTRGVNEIEFKLEEQEMVLIDVGGQRTERSKWASCFDNVHCVLFCVALDDYARFSKEYPKMNALQESLEVFEWAVNNYWFERKDVLVFLNKKDVFEKIIKKIPLEKYFPDFSGDSTSYEESLKFIKKLFLARNRSHQRKIYVHATCAIDTRNVESVFCVAVNSVLKQEAQSFGL